jgi:YesN/AraC family two-component response regulator
VREGYATVVEAGDGETALARLRRERFDIIITDVRMPLMSGLELLVQAKQEFPKISVIVMTGFGDIHTPDEAKDLGADEYVTKPFKAREIEVIVERVRMRQIVSGRVVHRAAAAVS